MNKVKDMVREFSYTVKLPASHVWLQLEDRKHFTAVGNILQWKESSWQTTKQSVFAMPLSPHMTARLQGNKITGVGVWPPWPETPCSTREPVFLVMAPYG